VYPTEQLEDLKRYCSKLSLLTEGGGNFLYLKGLRLPPGCQPDECDALLCPVPRDGYPSRLFLSVQVSSRYARNWNGTVRIGEKNWFAFSWRVPLEKPTLAQMLIAHLTGFTKAQ
jgi:hypothetical protein